LLTVIGAALHTANAVSLLQRTVVHAETPANATGAAQNNGISAARGLYTLLKFAKVDRIDICGQNTWAPPTLCSAEKAHWSNKQIEETLPEFAKLYEGRPITNNVWGMNTNHAFALWYMVRTLKPKHIVESGVFQGQGTWLLRAAAGPDAKIYSLDPVSKMFLKYRDESPNTQYYMGHLFKDLNDMPWDSLIPAEERESTLVVLDDHQSAVSRARDLLALGFVHLFYDDNYKTCSDCYSFNTVCSPVPSTAASVLFVDKNAQVKRDLSKDEHAANLDYLKQHMETYFEFPPILDGCGWGRETILGGESELASYGLPELESDPYRYASGRPPYVKLRQ